MIRISNDLYILGTPGTHYLFRVLPTGHLEHLYYGSSLGDLARYSDEALTGIADALTEKRAFPAGNMISYDAEHPELTLEDLRLEMSSRGRGDIREPFVSLVYADGNRTSDFLFESAEVSDTKPEFMTLPGSYAEGPAEHLTVTLRDRLYDTVLELHYYVYEDCDCICRSAKLVNESAAPIRIDRLMSAMLDFEYAGWVMRTFHGAWAREMHPHDVTLVPGCYVSSSHTGTSSNRANPFTMLFRDSTTETSGRCIGMNLIYSGDHYEAGEVNAYGKTRLMTGIDPSDFSWLLEPGGSFEAPEAVMTASGRGFRGVSMNMHAFVRKHILRGVWKDRVRPVLLNSWEAAYFKIDEGKLLKMAKAAKEIGVELFVMDDGWFGERNDDSHSLGDWEPDPKKLPGGLKQIADKIRGLGLDFGIWVEPEMVNTQSELYRAHPEWTMEVPGHPHSEGRNQRLLDFANPEVVDYMTEQMTRVFSSAEISYVKWDMNRIMSDRYSQSLPAERQKETAHRYMTGVYRMMKTLTERFPQILFEGCASGGNRFDLGILCYFPQIWGSDDTDPLERVFIQEGYSFGYPLSCVGAHVSSSPNHQTLRESSFVTRFNVAVFGSFGLELNLADLPKTELKKIAASIALYKEWREVLQKGTFYRINSGNHHEWTCVSPDRKKAVGLFFHALVQPNRPFGQFRAAGLDPDAMYHFYNVKFDHDIRTFGDLVNTVSPIHVKQDSAMHRLLARHITMPGESEDVTVPGSILMSAGIKLSGAYTGTGYNDQTRHFQDLGSRLYFMEMVEPAETGEEQ